MNSNEFNRKYSLSNELTKKIELSKRTNQISSVAGKPKILWFEILKRFLSNPMVVISAIAFLMLILTAIFVYYLSPYTAGIRVDSHWKYKTDYIFNLPPEFTPTTKTDFTSTNAKKLGEIAKNPYTKEYADFTINKARTLVTYDAYKFRYGSHLLSLIQQWETNHPGDSITPAIVQDFKDNQMKELHTWFGTTEKGSDVWTTVWVGTLQSMKIALIVATIETIIGVAIGTYLGFHAGKWLDTIMMRVIEIFVSPPAIIWLLLFVSIWGTNDWVLIFGLLFVGWTGPIGGARMFCITVKDEEYIVAAKSIGASTARQIYMHALPAIAGKLAMSFVRRIPSVILTIASLAFLGFFNDDKSSNLGKFMLDNLGASEINPWLLILPASILLILSLSLQFIAIGLHDALDPRVIRSKK